MFSAACLDCPFLSPECSDYCMREECSDNA